VNRKILAFIRQEHMLSPGDHVICAVSGGKDSMALLHVLLRLRGELGITVTAAHFNHMLRGAEAQRDEDFVRSYCASQNIPLAVGRGDVSAYAAAHKMGTEEAARTLRYEFLLGLSPDAKLATAHTAEDNLETMLLHLLRGCSLHGLSAIAPIRGRIIRPLLLTQQAEILSYLEQQQVPHVEDSSNQEDFCLRNRLRHHVLPLLTAENPALAGSVSKLCLRLGQEDRYLEAAAREALASLCQEGCLSCKALLELPEAMALRVLKLYLEPVPQCSSRHLEAALALLQGSPSGSLSLPDGYVLRRSYDSLELQQEAVSVELPTEAAIAPGQTLWFGPWQISCALVPRPDAPEVGALYLTPCPGPLTLRSRQPGDRITLPVGTKKVSRLMIDEKLPLEHRDTLPVVCQGDTLLAVLPLKAAHPAKPGEVSLCLTVKNWRKYHEPRS
jgi:tRNA(Ile)-lysidine synthase